MRTITDEIDILDNLPIGLLKIRNNQKETIKLNKYIINLLGYNEDEIKQIDLNQIYSNNDLIKIKSKMNDLYNKKINNYHMTLEAKSKNDLNMFLDVYIIYNEKEDLFYFFISNITDLKKKEVEVIEIIRNKNLIFNNFPGLIYRSKDDKDYTMTYLSKGCFNLTGYRENELLNNKQKSFADIIHEEDLEKTRNIMKNKLKEKEVFQLEYRIITKENKIKWVLEYAEGVFDENDNIKYIEGMIFDITRLKELNNKIEYNIKYDSLTNLLNRNSLLNEIDEHNNGTLFLVNMKNLYIKYGDYGFTNVQKIKKEIRDFLIMFENEKFRLFYIQENGFAFYYKALLSKEEVDKINDKIIDKLTNYFSLNISVGVGIVANYQKLNSLELLNKAIKISELALEPDGLYNTIYFTEEIENKIRRTQTIKDELLLEIESKENNLYMEYQPIIDLRDNSIFAVEALARFNSKSYGSIAPAEFISIAESNRFIYELGLKIIDISLNFISRYRLNFKSELKLSINISVNQFYNINFINDIKGLVEKNNLLFNNIILEVTESIFASNLGELEIILNDLRNIGFLIALDDFGKRYSNLIYLQELKFDIIKIDKSFTSRITNGNKVSLIGDIINISRKLDSLVVTEGVETLLQDSFLKELKCDMVQGYYYSKPINEERLEEFIKNYK